MPVVTFDYNDFLKIFGYEISKEDLIKRLPMIGADFDKIENDEISIEFFPNRPDLSSVEGIARASRAFFGFEKGMKKYEVEKSEIIIEVDPSLKSIRPFVTCALVTNITMTDELISSLMDMQEKLHFGIGRNRKKVAIGVHNYEPLEPPFVYKAADPDYEQFVPLAKVESMTLRDILKHHEKGVEYANLLEGFDKYPLIVDSNKNVLSFPPIINGSLTEVTPFTTDLFIDVTGTNIKTINQTLNIVITALAERGGKIYSTKIKYDRENYFSPDLNPVNRTISISYINKILGTKMNEIEVIDSLNKMGYNADKLNEDKIDVKIPPWRADILHDIDLVEDVSVGYGYDKFEIDFPKILTFGRVLPYSELFNGIRNIMIGLGFNEVSTFTLSNEKDEFEKMGLKEGKRVQIKNPIGEEYSCLRVSLIPSILKILAENRHHSLPQQIFELGIIVDSNFKNIHHLAAIKMDAKANFTECKSLVDAVMRDSGKKYIVEVKEHPAFVNGRCASVVCDNEEIGFFGELHPKTITQFYLEHPIISFELKVENLK
jgi:phenylalanyl-tRNA synthetase beta chain